MNCQSANKLIPEHLDGTLSAADTRDLRAHLDSCPDCRRELEQLTQTLTALDHLPAEEPSPRLRENFQAMLRAELRAPEPRPSWIARLSSALEQLWASMAPRPLLQFSYSMALVLVGLFVGSRFLAPSTPVPAASDATQRELADLKGRIDSMGQLVALSMIRQEPDNARLHQIATTLTDGKPDNKQLTQLINSLAFDPSTNVRISALEALYPYAQNRLVREGVLVSLPRERSPLVQLAMIDFLTSVRDQQATQAFEAISRDTAADKSVREAARRAIAQL